MKSGRLILIPSFLAEDNSAQQFPASALTEIMLLRYFVVERAKTARRFLRAIGYEPDFDDVNMQELQKHNFDDVDQLLQPCRDGHDLGLISEAGVPGVADPGGQIVNAAHARGIKVVPLIGPSSILLALMGAGMNGQHFYFHGYLPRDEGEVSKKLKALEAESRQSDLTQIFIETPYRNDRLMKAMLKVLHPTTQLCLATDLSALEESIQTHPIATWQKNDPSIGKRPTVFLLYAGELYT